MNHLTLRVKITLKNLSVYTVSIPNKLVVIRKLIYRALHLRARTTASTGFYIKDFSRIAEKMFNPESFIVLLFT